MECCNIASLARRLLSPPTIERRQLPPTSTRLHSANPSVLTIVPLVRRSRGEFYWGGGMRHYFCTVLVPVAALTAQAIAIPASAADLSVPRAPLYTKAQPVTPVQFDWSGFYAGAHAGYDWGRAHVIDNGVLTENSVPMNGAIGGLLAGINWQTGMFVYGLEGDVGLSSLRGHGTLPPPPPPPPTPAPPPAPLASPNAYDVDLSGNIRARIGVAVMPSTLIYAAGGFALTQFKFRENSGPIQNKELLMGWTIGAGVDQAFTKNLIGRVEYLYADYGHKNFAVAPGDIYNIGFKAQVVRGALVWKF